MNMYITITFKELYFKTTMPVNSKKECWASMDHGKECDQDDRHANIWKRPLKVTSGSKGIMIFLLGILEPIIVCSKDDQMLTLTYLITRSNLVLVAFIWGKCLKVIKWKKFTKRERLSVVIKSLFHIYYQSLPYHELYELR